MVAVCQVLGCIHAIKLIILDSLISDKQTGELLVDPDNDCKDDEQPIKPKEPKGPGTFTVTLISGWNHTASAHHTLKALCHDIRVIFSKLVSHVT